MGVSPLHFNLHRNRRYFVIKLHTWFCLSYFLKKNITFYCIYQYYMSINSFFNTVPVSVSRYSRPITNETSHVTTHATHSDPWPNLARSTRFFLIMLFNKIWKIDSENLWQKIVLSRNFSYNMLWKIYCRDSKSQPFPPIWNDLLLNNDWLYESGNSLYIQESNNIFWLPFESLFKQKIIITRIVITVIRQTATIFIFIIPSLTKLRRDIVTLPSVRPSITSLWTL